MNYAVHARRHIFSCSSTLVIKCPAGDKVWALSLWRPDDGGREGNERVRRGERRSPRVSRWSKPPKRPRGDAFHSSFQSRWTPGGCCCIAAEGGLLFFLGLHLPKTGGETFARVCTCISCARRRTIFFFAKTGRVGVSFGKAR